MAEINDRIKKIRDIFCESNNTIFAKKLEYSAQFASGLCSKSSVGKNVIEKILTAFPDVNRSWLILGEGNMLKGDSVNQTNNGSVGGDMIACSKNYTQEDIQRLKRENEELRNQVKQLLRISESLTAIISKSNDESTIRESYDALAKEI